ncbi:hypothetical protein E4U60_005364 [Claviceps pazoutovae]|uniref:Uncharacterized protein n=1 Tax=Claviceps pazoutovae TaxID=1649127 RepID=A0A9P7SE86_9HYPO|nr:hypothetical protein E4U60_005364 [Claviceps pazoutovae]
MAALLEAPASTLAARQGYRQKQGFGKLCRSVRPSLGKSPSHRLEQDKPQVKIEVRGLEHAAGLQDAHDIVVARQPHARSIVVVTDAIVAAAVLGVVGVGKDGEVRKRRAIFTVRWFKTLLRLLKVLEHHLKRLRATAPEEIVNVLALHHDTMLALDEQLKDTRRVASVGQLSHQGFMVLSTALAVSDEGNRITRSVIMNHRLAETDFEGGG